MANIFGHNFPFYDRTFVLPVQADLRIIKNDIIQLLLTSPGERVMRPTYGTLLRKFPFEQLDSASITELERSIATSLRRFERRATLRNIVINGNAGEGFLEISLIMALTNDPQIEFNVGLRVANPAFEATTRGSVQ